jgi:arylformamidase
VPVYRDYEQADLDAQLNPRASTPSFFHHLRRWSELSERARGVHKSRLDLAYGPGDLEKLDFFPAPGKVAPLLAFFHGGEWQSLDKSDFSFLAPAFLERGVAVALVNYGLAPAAKLGAMMEQSRNAVAWLYRNAAELDIDPTRIHLAGHGAGSHLAMLAASMPQRPYELLGHPVRSVIGLGGIYDLEPVRLSFLNSALELDRDEAWRLSPAHWPPPASCRVLVVSGGRESLELRRQARSFAASWRERGAAVEALELPGEDHFSLLGQLCAPEGPLGRAALMQVLEL